MAAVMPGLSDAPAYDGMAAEDDVDLFVGCCAALGVGVLSGCLVTQHGSGTTMAVDISSGLVSIGGNLYVFAGATNLTVTAAGSGAGGSGGGGALAGDRRDTVVLRLATGTVTAHVIQGVVPSGLSGAWSRAVQISTCLPPEKGPMNWTATPVSTSVNAYTDAVAGEIYVPYNATGITGTTSTIVSPTSGNLVDKTLPPGLQIPLQPTAIKTGAYTANPFDFVLCNATSSFTISLPTAPADKTKVGVKMIEQTAGTDIITVATGGSDVINVSSTSITLKLLSQGVILQYDAGNATWYVQADDLQLGQLDLRYLELSGSNTMTGALNMGDEAITDVSNLAVAWTHRRHHRLPVCGGDQRRPSGQRDLGRRRLDRRCRCGRNLHLHIVGLDPGWITGNIRCRYRGSAHVVGH